ncbi:MAG: FAD:protein FMN transferase [Treponema sp.]|nr:FAD:protein FMN transferase [Treponema sp.]
MIFFVVFSSCTQTEAFRSEFAMGTVCTVTLFDKADSNTYNKIFNRIREMENLMSVNIETSDISRINAAAGISPVNVHEDVFKVIESAIHYAQISDGAFDPSVGPLVSLWGITGDNPRLPSRKEIEEALLLINWQDIEMNAQEKSVFLKNNGMALDLGGIAKGYAADEATLIIKNAGVKGAIIDLGGNIILHGEKKDRSPWRVGVQKPNTNRGEYIGILNISNRRNQSVVTSGVYERYFEKDGKKYHHLFDPSCGYPAENGLVSVTVITPVSMDADALSTAVFVSGYEKGRTLAESLPETEAVFVFDDSTVRVTAGVNFTLTDKSFILAD